MVKQQIPLSPTFFEPLHIFYIYHKGIPALPKEQLHQNKVPPSSQTKLRNRFSIWSILSVNRERSTSGWTGSHSKKDKRIWVIFKIKAILKNKIQIDKCNHICVRLFSLTDTHSWHTVTAKWAISHASRKKLFYL